MYVPPDLPPALAEVLAQVRALPRQTATGMAARERQPWLVGLRAMVDAAEAGFLEVLAAFDSDGDRLHAARSTAAWLRGAAHLAPGDASERVRLALALRQGLLVAPVTGMATGAVTYDQTRAIVRATVPLSPARAPGAVATLTELARRADAGQVRVAGRHLEVLCPVGTQIDDAGLAPARLPQVPGGPGLLLPVAVDRIACDAAVSRVLLGPDGLRLECRPPPLAA